MLEIKRQWLWWRKVLTRWDRFVALRHYIQTKKSLIHALWMGELRKDLFKTNKRLKVLVSFFFYIILWKKLILYSDRIRSIVTVRAFIMLQQIYKTMNAVLLNFLFQRILKKMYHGFHKKVSESIFVPLWHGTIMCRSRTCVCVCVCYYLYYYYYIFI